MQRKILSIFAVIVAITLIALISGCPPKSQKATPSPEDSHSSPSPTASVKKPRPVVNLTEEQKAEVKKLLGMATKAEFANKLSESLEILDKVLKIDPNNMEAYEAKGRISIRESLFPQAQEAYENMIDIDPKNFEGYVGLARALVESGKAQANPQKIEEAIKVCNEAINLKPDQEKAYSTLAYAYFFLGHNLIDRDKRAEAYKKSVEYYRKAIEKDDKLPGNYFKLIESANSWYSFSSDKSAIDIGLEYGKIYEKKFPKDPNRAQTLKKIAQLRARVK